METHCASMPAHCATHQKSPPSGRGCSTPTASTPMYATTSWPPLAPAGSSNAASTALWRSWLCAIRTVWTSMSCAAGAGTKVCCRGRGTHCSDTGRRRLHRDRAQAHFSAHPHLATATHRPRACFAALSLLIRGQTHTQIAAILRVSPQTAGRLHYGARLSLSAQTLPIAVAIGYVTGVFGRNRGNGETRPGGAYRAGFAHVSGRMVQPRSSRWGGVALQRPEVNDLRLGVSASAA